MKRFIFSILCVAVFFIGLGALVEKTGAKFKSDERALALIAKSRQAIGGDSAISNIMSLSIVGRSMRSFKIDGAVKSEEGETEIALQLPGQMMRSVRSSHGDGDAKGLQTFERSVNVAVAGEDKDHRTVTVNGEGHGERAGTGVRHQIVLKIKKDDGTVQELTGADAEKWIAEHPDVGGEDTIVIRKGDGDHPEFKTEGGKTVVSDGDHFVFNRVGAGEHHEGMRQNELLRTTLGLLLTAPAGMDVNYTCAGDGDVDGTSCYVVVAEFAGSSFRLYLSKASSLPVMMSYKGVKEPQVFTYHTATPQGGDEAKQNMVFTRKIEGGPAGGAAEFNVKFSDYRSVGGVQLPYKWTQPVGGEPDETFDVISYEINPANIADKFKNQNVMVRMKKPENN